MGIASKQVNTLQVNFTIKDTEFLLRLINNSNILGTDVVQCADTMKKLEQKHQELLNKNIGI
tara:strand:+ start:298 stop:483 length:186 start_codon:yes stop_codon:yes gene_type:complete